MKKLLILTAIFIFSSQLLFAQSSTHSIQIIRHWYGWRLKHDGKKVKTVRQLTKIVKPDPVAAGILRKAKRAQAIGMSIDMSSIVFTTAYHIYWFSRFEKGVPYSRMNPDIPFAVVLGTWAISIPFAFSAGHNVKKAVRTYNSDLHKASYRNNTAQYFLSVSPNSIGLTMKF